MFLNQAHIPLRSRQLSYALLDTLPTTLVLPLPGRTMSSLPPSPIRHQFAGLQRMPGRCSSNVATELADLAVTVTLSRSGCRFILLQFRSLSCAWLFAAVNAHIHCRLQCSAFTAAKSSPLSNQNCTNCDATGASRDDFFFLVSFDLSITTSQTNVSYISRSDWVLPVKRCVGDKRQLRLNGPSITTKRPENLIIRR